MYRLFYHNILHVIHKLVNLLSLKALQNKPHVIKIPLPQISHYNGAARLIFQKAPAPFRHGDSFYFLFVTFTSYIYRYFLSASTLSSFSQGRSRSLRPKCP